MNTLDHSLSLILMLFWGESHVRAILRSIYKVTESNFITVQCIIALCESLCRLSDVYVTSQAVALNFRCRTIVHKKYSRAHFFLPSLQMDFLWATATKSVVQIATIAVITSDLPPGISCASVPARGALLSIDPVRFSSPSRSFPRYFPVILVLESHRARGPWNWTLTERRYPPRSVHRGIHVVLPRERCSHCPFLLAILHIFFKASFITCRRRSGQECQKKFNEEKKVLDYWETEKLDNTNKLKSIFWKVRRWRKAWKTREKLDDIAESAILCNIQNHQCRNLAVQNPTLTNLNMHASSKLMNLRDSVWRKHSQIHMMHKIGSMP